MDRRTELSAGTALDFPGMNCVIGRCIGRGSNAIVYEGEYCDASNSHLKHRVLVKELFPFDGNGHIWRDEKQHIAMDAQGEAVWALHRRSFERGNAVHLQLLAQTPDQIGGNLNTYALNGTLYTLLDYTGGRSMDKALQSGSHQTLDQIVERMRKLLFVLRTFHEQGFLHLDISLDNVLLIGQGETERVLLIDYNSVHARDELQSNDVYFSAKEGFTPPEVRTGRVQAIAPCTDLFSVACVFYALLTGAPPTMVQMSRRKPPDAADSPYLKDVPATVRAQVGLILRRGLCVLPDRRYQHCDDMLRDLEELRRRIHGIGVTHAALWEAGRRSVHRLVQQNPSLEYVQREAELYPLRMQFENGGSMPAKTFMQLLEQGEAASALLLGDGGMGKSTALLRTALEQTAHYSPAQPAVLYLPLMGRKDGAINYILDRILIELHFDAQTQTMEDARHALITLLNPPQKANRKTNVRLLLLLDGLNEATGDTAGLMEELKRLSAYPALRMVIASRTAPEELDMARACMMPLELHEVSDTLTRHGLLLPESEGMRELLKTPMMLSLFIQTAQHTENQVLCQSQEELISAYLDALCMKAAREGSRPVDYQVEAAVRLVLPAIAREIRRQGQPLNDQALFRVVRRCHGILRSRALTGSFPAWIGHTAEVFGDYTDNAEAWYGEIVQSFLWRKLGLLVRDEAGCYRVLHQILLEHFAVQATANERKIRACRLKTGAFAGVVLLLLACISLLVYEVWLKPKPYDEAMSEKAMDAAVMQYVNCGLQYEAMTEMLAGRIGADACEAKITAAGVPASRSAEMALDAMSTDGEVIPWSTQPFDMENAEVLLALPQERAETYARYVTAYLLVCSGNTGTTESEFTQALAELLEADADIAWLLEQIVCAPHVEGMDSQQRVSFDTGLLSLPAMQENRSADVSHGLPYALEKAYERRRLALNELNRLAVMYDPAVKEDGE